MKIENLKDFKALVKACRLLGVSSIDVGEISIRLGPMPVKQRSAPAIDQTSFPEAEVKVPRYDGPITDVEAVPTEGLTEDQLLMWSAQGQQNINETM